MHLKSLVVQDFKRFTHLTIANIPPTAQLVVLAGPNGSGKSTIFEALNLWRRTHSGFGMGDDDGYWAKFGGATTEHFQNRVQVELHEGAPGSVEAWRKAIWVRSAYRHDAAFKLSSLTRLPDARNDQGLLRLVEAEQRVSANYQRLVGATLSSVYDGFFDEVPVKDLRSHLVGKLRSAMVAVFGDLMLEGTGNPLDNGTFLFTKGTATNFPYENISAGEKAAFDLLLDLLLRIDDFDDTIFCIDEPEIHIGTRTQGRLLRSMLDFVGAHSQLVLATHSIGMMREARDLAAADPDRVAFLDTSEHDFDSKVVMEPVVPDRRFWQKVLLVALDDLAELVAPEIVILCEGQPADEWDARCYRAIFGQAFPQADFISVGNSLDVQGDRAQVGAAVTALVPGTKVLRVRDRDELNEDEVKDLEKQGVRILSRRHLESYLLADDVLHAYAAAQAQPEEAVALVTARDGFIADAVTRRGKSPDDFKAVAGLLQVELKRRFKLVNTGSNARAFMAGTLAPSLKQGMPSYEALKKDIFGDG